jgi:hypothetical protein
MSLEVVMEISDASGSTASHAVHLADTVTLAQATSFSVGYATALNNIIAGVIRSCAAYLKPSIASLLNNTVGANSDVEHIGKFEFLTEEGIRVKINIPCLSELTVHSDFSDEIDQAQADVAAFIAAMTDGILSGGAQINPCDIGEGDVTDIVFAREAARNSGARR